jgi:hypothetical protein
MEKVMFLPVLISLIIPIPPNAPLVAVVAKEGCSALAQPAMD